jgi:hypothetical protein
MSRNRQSHTDLSKNKKEHMLLTMRGTTRSTEVEEERDPSIEEGNTIISMDDGDQKRTSINCSMEIREGPAS